MLYVWHQLTHVAFKERLLASTLDVTISGILYAILRLIILPYLVPVFLLGFFGYFYYRSTVCFIKNLENIFGNGNPYV